MGCKAGGLAIIAAVCLTVLAVAARRMLIVPVQGEELLGYSNLSLSIQANDHSSVAGGPIKENHSSAVAEQLVLEDTAPGVCRKTMLPSIAYLGYPHSGSTSLAEVLNSHPNVSYGRQKENKFMCHMSIERHFFYHGVERYYRFWRKVPCEATLAIDMNPTTFGAVLDHHSQWFHRDVGRNMCRIPKQVRDWVDLLGGPSLRFLVMLRNPVDMLKSMYGIEKFFRYYDKMMVLGCYVEVLEAWRTAFPEVELKVVSSEDQFRDPVAFFTDLFQWIGVPNYPPEYYESLKTEGRRRFETRSFKGKLTEEMNDTDYERFLHNETMVDCKARLEKLLNRTFDWKGAPPR